MPIAALLVGRRCFFAMAALALLLGLVRPAAGQEEMILVDAQHPPCPIVYDPQLGKAELAAAKELSRYLEEITGQAFALQKAEGPLPERAIVIGPLEIQAPADLGPEGFVLKVAASRLHIVGGGPNGVIYGIYGLLEDDLGCRWWSWNEEDVPRRAELRIQVDRQEKPAFLQHNLFNQEAMKAPGKLRTAGPGGDVFVGGHNLCPMLEPYAQTQPSFLPMDKEGKRAFNNLHMNYTAPGMADALTQALEKLVQQRKGNVKDWIYFAGMGDWYGGMDLSPESKAIYEAEQWTDADGRKKPGYTATLLQMINQTAAQLEAKYPGVRVGTFAYMSLEAPPATIVPRDNVFIRVPRLRHATVRSIAESPKNQSFARNLERWCELAPGRVYVWEYGANFSNFLMPFPCLSSMAQNIKLYKKMGVAGVMIQGNYTSTGGDLAALKNYVWRKLLWNPEQDPEALTRAFCQGYYGPAAEHLFQYVQLLEQSVRGTPPSDADEFADPLKTYLTPALMKQLRPLLEAALAATDPAQGPYRRRVLEARASLEAAELWRKPPAKDPFVERDGKLVRSDLGEYTYPRALELVANLRGGGSAEWATGKAYQQSFLAWHGGPVATLESGATQLKIAPVLAGKIGPLTCAGEVAFTQSYVYVDSGKVRTAAFAENPQPQAASIVGEAGLGSWSGSASHLLRQSIEALGQGRYRIQQWARAAGGGANLARCSGRSETEYPVAAKLGNLALARWSEQDQAWQSVDLTPLIVAPQRKNPKEPLPSLTVPDTSRLRLQRNGVEIIDAWEVPAPALANPAVAPAAAATTATASAPAPAKAGAEEQAAGSSRCVLAYDAQAGVLRITNFAPAVAVSTTEDRLSLQRTLSVRIMAAASPGTAPAQ